MMGKNFPDLDHNGQIKYLTTNDGTRLRTASWPSSNDSRGIVILVNGHREFMEKYNEFFSDILGRGFALYALDNRGQGLSDRFLNNRMKSHAENFDIFPSDLNEFISKMVMTDPRAKELPIYLIAHSMGGHICLRYLHDFPEIISKAVIMSPMVSINLGSDVAETALKLIIRIVSRIGFSKNYAFGQGSFLSKESRQIKQKLLTHDDDRYAAEADVIESNPDLYVGGATFGWLNAALDSLNKMQEPGYLDKISIPLLVTLAGDDQVVNSKDSRELLSGHDNINIVTIKGARHEIYRESDKYRNQLWQKIDQFLTIK